MIGIDRDVTDGGVVADLADPDARREAIATVAHALGGIDVLVNCAGVWSAGGIANSSPAQWRALWSVDLEAPLDLVRLAAEHMAGPAWVVMVTSIHAHATQPESVAYAVAKAGLEAATRAAAIDLAPRGILVNAVAPGFVHTRMSVLEDGVDETETAAFRTIYVDGGRLPLRRSADAVEIAAPTAFLASRDNTYITGAVLAVDGGLSATF